MPLALGGAWLGGKAETTAPLLVGNCGPSDRWGNAGLGNGAAVSPRVAALGAVVLPPASSSERYSVF
jgi:hypothetical protein